MMNESHSSILTDVEKHLWLEEFELNSESAGDAAGPRWSIRKRTLRGGLCDGVDIVEIDNGVLSYTVVPTRGMGLWRGSYKGREIGWKSPVTGPVNPQFINELEQGGLGWLKGFDEWVVRCGLNSNGAPCTDIVPDNNGNPSEVSLTLHGKIANLPANRVEVRVIPGPPVELVIIGVVEEAMLFSPQFRLTTTIRTVVGSNRVDVRDEICNVREVPGELELLYHCNYGMPFLEGGARLVAPSLEVAPRDARAMEGISDYGLYEAPVPGFVEQCYFHEVAADSMGATAAMLRNCAGDLGAVIRWNKSQMPCFTQWKNTVGEREGYVTGLEPGINYPNPKTFEREKGRVVTLQPGETYPVDLGFEFHDTVAAVASVEEEITGLLDGAETLVHPEPAPQWTSQ
ncbi:MAG: aldose 1-epimerase family protein [Lentisphaeria bacterium]|nr:aldose 1-epimerase family protein [Lentisphaeria bacterium]